MKKTIVDITHSSIEIPEEFNNTKTLGMMQSENLFTNNRGLSGVSITRPEWEHGIKGPPAGQKFYCTSTDNTMPGGPVEHTIEYVAPLDRCDREQDYETAWKFFEEKYGGQT